MESNPMHDAERAGVMGPNLLALMVRFSNEEESDEYLGKFLEWVKSNLPPPHVKVAYVKFFTNQPNPHSIGFFFHQDIGTGIRDWFARWTNDRQYYGIEHLGSTVVIENPRIMFLQMPIQMFVAATGWLGKETTHRQQEPVIHSFGEELPLSGQVIIISKEMIDKFDISRAREMFETHHKRFPHKCRNGVGFSIYGYGSDPRELYDIPAVRAYFQVLFDEEPGLFYWLDVNDALQLLFVMIYQPIRHENALEYRNDDLVSFIIRGQRKLSIFCAANGLSTSTTIEALKNMKW